MTPKGEEGTPTGSHPLVRECPMRKHVVEVIVLADDDRGLADACVEARSGMGVMRAKTDSRGWCRFEGLEAGNVDISLYQLDGKAWERIAGEPLPTERLSGSQQATWKADPGSPPAEVAARTLRAGKGESIATIAVANGFTPGQVWQYGANARSTVAVKLCGEVLQEGQTVELPPRRMRWETVAVDCRYYLHRIGVPFSLTIRFLDGVGRPRRRLRYLLRVATKSGQSDRSIYGVTDLDGYLIESVPPDATSGELLVQAGEETEKYPLLLAALEPETTVAGVQQRLNNLGYWCGDAYGTCGDGTREALRRFQRNCGLEETGEADAPTRKLLQAVHRS